MITPSIRIAFALLLLAISTTSTAESRRRPHDGGYHSHNDWHYHFKKRRDARRAGIVAGVVVGSVAGASGRANAERRFEECLMDGRYDEDCERRRYQDEQRVRRGAWRAGIAAGVVTREIVR